MKSVNIGMGSECAQWWLGPWVSHPLVQSFTHPNKLWYSTLNASELGNYRARKGGREMEDREDITRVISEQPTSEKSIS